MPDSIPVTGDQLVRGDTILGPASRRFASHVEPVRDLRLLAVLGFGAQVVYAVAAQGDQVPPRTYTRDDVVMVSVPRPIASAEVA